MIAAQLCLVITAVGVLITWPGQAGRWWVGPGARDSRAGRIRLAIGDVMMLGGLAAAIIFQVINVAFSVSMVLVVVAQLVLLALVARVVVRHWRQRTGARS